MAWPREAAHVHRTKSIRHATCGAGIISFLRSEHHDYDGDSAPSKDVLILKFRTLCYKGPAGSGVDALEGTGFSRLT